MSAFSGALAGPMDRIGRAAGAAIVRELADRLEVTAAAIAENRPLDEALERHVATLERRLVPLLESSLRRAPGTGEGATRTDR